MQMRFFTIPIKAVAVAQEEANRFLRTHRVLVIERQFVANGENSFWSLAVEYIEGETEATAVRQRERIDYMQVLPPEQFAVFAKLRSRRKEVAASDGVPPFAVFTDAQLAAIVTGNVRSDAELRRIEGVGEGKSQRYGGRFLDLLRELEEGTDTTGKNEQE
jgi:superfamily II DNA helicase RecQ